MYSVQELRDHFNGVSSIAKLHPMTLKWAKYILQNRHKFPIYNRSELLETITKSVKISKPIVIASEYHRINRLPATFTYNDIRVEETVCSDSHPSIPDVDDYPHIEDLNIPLRHFTIEQHEVESPRNSYTVVRRLIANCMVHPSRAYVRNHIKDFAQYILNEAIRKQITIMVEPPVDYFQSDECSNPDAIISWFVYNYGYRYIGRIFAADDDCMVSKEDFQKIILAVDS